MTKKDDKAKRSKVHLPPDVIASFQALGDDWEARIEAVLRAHIDKPVKGKMRDFFADMAGPYLPQLETVAREVAGRVAKDVAAAAAAAAMAGWASGGKAEEAAAPKPKAAATRKPAAKKAATAPTVAKRPAARAKPAAKPKRPS